MKNKIILLSETEIDDLYNLPNFTKSEMEFFFSLSNEDYACLSKCRTLKNQIYFILQLGYFRATQQFYNFTLQNLSKEASYVNAKYFDKQNNLKSVIDKPYRETITFQQNIILKLHNYTNWSTNLTPKIEAHLTELIRYHPKPEIAMNELLKYFKSGKLNL